MKNQHTDKAAAVRRSGIDIIGDAPWGTHFCQFYQTKQDLIDTLVPYFKAGLESNEFCMWVTAEPLGVEEAALALRSAVPDLDSRMARGQIEIIPHTDWYLLGGGFDQDRVLNGWVDKLDDAVARGYEGLRLTGNTFWLEKADWQSFTDYEEAVNNVLGNYRMLALCTYSVDKCGAGEIANVAANHEFALIKRAGKWTMIESSTVRQAKQALEAANEELRAVEDELRRELSERKLVEEALRESESVLRAFFDSPGVFRGIVELVDGDLRYVSVNKAVAEVHGLTQEAACGKFLSELGTPPEVLRDYVNRCEESRRTGKAVTFELLRHLGDGDRWLQATTSYQGMSQTGCPRFAYVMRDITEHKQAEEALRQSEERLRLLGDNLPESAVYQYAYDRDGKPHFLYFSSGIERLNGVKVEDVLKDVSVLHSQILPEYYAALMEAEAVCARDLSDFSMDVQMRRSDGEIRWMRLRSRPRQLPDGSVVWDGVQTDVTESKQAEEALRESERRYSALFANKINGMAHCRVITDEHGRPVNYRILQINEAYEEIIGVKKADIEGRLVTEVFPDIKNYAYDYIGVYGKIALEGGETKFEEFFEASQQYLSIYAYSPAPGEFIAIFTDITERKRAEEALRESEEQVSRQLVELNSIYNSAHVGLCVFDRALRYVRINERLAEINGVPASDHIGKTVQEVVPDLAPLAEELAERIFRTGEGVTDIEFSGATKAQPDTLRHWIEQWLPLKDEAGNVVGINVVVEDVTERVEFERQRESLLAREHLIAETLQQALIPSQIPTTVAGCHFVARYVPALAEAQVGGDFYDVFDLGDGRVAVLIGDVVGKGVQAAMQVSAARYAFRSYAYIESSPSRVVGLVNDALCKGQGSEMGMLTAFFAVVDTHSRTISYTNAGHEPPVIRRASGSVEELKVGARALGVMPGCDYPEGSLKLEEGDTVVLVTDGITEARSEEHGMFDKSGLLRFLAEEAAPPSELVDRLLAKAREYGNGHLQDDVVIVALGLEMSCVEVGCNG